MQILSLMASTAPKAHVIPASALISNLYLIDLASARLRQRTALEELSNFNVLSGSLRWLGVSRVPMSCLIASMVLAIEVVVVASLPGGLQAVDVLDHGLLIEEHVSGKSSGDCKCEDDGLHVGYYIKFNHNLHLYSFRL